MKRRIAVLLCLLMVWAQAAVAEDRTGKLAYDTELLARQAGMQVMKETSFAWGGLPLLDDDTNKALTSLFKVLGLQSRAQGTEEAGYRAWDVLLQKVSVLDLTMRNERGVYYEQSNLLGGQTVAFTADEFRTFIAGLSARTGGAIPTNLDIIFATAMRALGAGEIPLDMETLDGSLLAFNSWQDTALLPVERLRPVVSLPGLYGVRSVVIDVTREELIALAQAYSDLLADNEALWLEAAQAQMTQAQDADSLREAAQRTATIMRDLPRTLEGWLPETLPPSEYREVFGADDQLVCKQLDIVLPGDAFLYVEWVPGETHTPALYASFGIGESEAELVLTREMGSPQKRGSETKVRNNTVAQWSYEEAALRLDTVLTYTENISARSGRETVTGKIELMMESEALLGEGAVVTLSGERTETTSGTIQQKYAHGTETVWRLKGLGFDTRKILTVTEKTTLAFADAVPALPEEIVRPAQMDDAALDAWLEGTRVSLLQTWYTVLGRLPADVATYLLKMIQQ